MRLSFQVVTLSLLFAVAAPSSAQNVNVGAASDTVRASIDTAQAVQRAAPSTATGASITGLRAGVHAREAARPIQPTVAAPRAGLGQARAMMIVGLAALIAGAIIDGTVGTIVMVGGAVIGLVGLYEYLQ
jgi:hypothetical protein